MEHDVALTSHLFEVDLDLLYLPSCHPVLCNLLNSKSITLTPILSEELYRSGDADEAVLVGIAQDQSVLTPTPRHFKTIESNKIIVITQPPSTGTEWHPALAGSRHSLLRVSRWRRHADREEL